MVRAEDAEAGMGGDAARTGDGELLERFASRGDEKAFEELARRHAGLVYGSALRVLNDPAGAEDASQAAFIVLARKARTLAGRPLAGWLYRTAAFIALRMKREQERRRRREKEASAMRDGGRSAGKLIGALRAELDSALTALPERYSAPIVMHYLAGLSQEDAASELGLAAAAFRKRLSRGMESLRSYFERRGVVVTGSVLATALAAEAAKAAPAKLVAAIAAAGLGGKAAGSAAALSIAEGAMRAMMLAKLKVAAAVLAVAMAAGTGAGVIYARAQEGGGTVSGPAGEEKATPRGAVVNIGGIDVPADCPLARGEHPRLLFTKADLPRLRERLKDPAIARLLDEAKALAEPAGMKGTDQYLLRYRAAVLMGTLWQLTGERKYADAAIRRLREDSPGSVYVVFPLAFDLIADAMTEEERKAEVDRMVKYVKEQVYVPGRFLFVLAAWGHGQDESLAPVFKSAYDKNLVEMIAYNNAWSSGRGGSSMSHGYNGEHFYSVEFATAVAATNALGADWIGRCDFAAHTPGWYIYHYRPWTFSEHGDNERIETLHIGVNMEVGNIGAVLPTMGGGECLAALAVSRFHDGLGQWWMNEVVPNAHDRWSRAGWSGTWGRLLWYDPKLAATPPSECPPVRLFPENGHVVMRSDWTQDATYALFRCGRFGEIDGEWGRNNADNLSFIILKRGILAADTGGTHSGNSSALGFVGVKPGDASPHIRDYARQTIAHNSITVGREPIVMEPAWNGGPRDVILRGGQSPRQPIEWFKQWGLEPPASRTRHKDGEISAFETSPLFDYACGDAKYSYPPERVKSITRQFVYLRPDTFVVFDRVEAAKPDLETVWNLHALYRPEWSGETADDLSLPPEKQLILDDAGGRIPNPNPGGRYAHAGEGVFTIDDLWEGMTGGLRVRPLLPRPEDRTLRTVGGPWHDFEVDGVNVGPTEKTYSEKMNRENAYSRMNSVPHNHTNCVGVGGWRIEMSPKRQEAATRFLVVMHACDRGAGAMPPSELVEVAGRPGAKVSLNNRVYEVTFNPTGEVGGHIRIAEGGKVLVDRPLAAKVEDNLAKWSSDPRFVKWMTDPAFENLVGKAEREAYARNQGH